MFKVEVSDGKYAVVVHDDGRMEALRHGEPWGRDLVGDNLVHAMAWRIHELEREVAEHSISHSTSTPADLKEQPQTERIWECKIGGVVRELSPGADAPMRNAIANAFRQLTGADADFCFSGWGSKLTEIERAVVEKRAPIVPPAPTFQQLCDLLPEGTNWSDPITPDVLRYVLAKDRSQLAQTPAPAADLPGMWEAADLSGGETDR